MKLKLKLAEAVKYKGGIVVTGIKEGTTNELIERKTRPSSLTYIWKIIPTPNDDQSDIYIIQHIDGLFIDFFEHQKPYFGETTNWEYLKKQNWTNPETNQKEPMRFLYCFEEDLESLNPVKEEPVKEEPIAEPSVNEEEEEEFEVDVQFKKNKQEIEQVVQQEINQKIDSINHPHFTSQTCPTNAMIELFPKSKPLYGRKMTEPFTVELASGKIIQGRGGDYLLKTQHNTVFIEPKETYDFMYQNKPNVTFKKLGKDQINYQLEQEVADYITLLEQDNEKYRIEKYLK